MATTQEDVIEELVTHVPAMRGLYEIHIAEYEELLPNVLLSDTVRWLIEDYQTTGELQSPGGQWLDVLNILERKYTESLDAEELIAFSFLEMLPYPDEPGYTIVERLGPVLRTELNGLESRPESEGGS